MSQSFIKRNLIVDIDGLIIRDPMKITATITKDGDSNQPDFGQVTIMNLSQTTRSILTEESKKMSIYAGYGENENLIITGDIQSIISTKEGTEWITEVIIGDGATALKQAILNKTYDRPITNKDLIKDMVRVSGLSDQPVEFIDVDDATQMLRGFTVNGAIEDELTSLTATAGMNWNIQGGKVVVSKTNKAREVQAYLISVDTGMIGSPEIVNTGSDLTDKKAKSGKRLKVKALCIPSVRPNDRVRIKTTTLQGRVGSVTYNSTVDNPIDEQYKVMSVDHNLDSREGPFETTMEVEDIIT